MIAYVDTSALIAAYCLQNNSDKAVKWLDRASRPIALTPFHRHEFRNAVRGLVYRGEITAQDRIETLQEFEDDFAQGLYEHQHVGWTDVFQQAEQIGSQFCDQYGIRSLDLLHLGIAKSLRAKKFVTLDIKQSEVARLCGFNLPIKLS